MPAEPPAPSASAVSVQPRKPKRSRWSTEEPEHGKSVPVPGLSAPVVLPASLAGLIDADAETLGLHRQLGEVSSNLAWRVVLLFGTFHALQQAPKAAPDQRAFAGCPADPACKGKA